MHPTKKPIIDTHAYMHTKETHQDMTRIVCHFVFRDVKKIRTLLIETKRRKKIGHY
jgi:hypothetical protein